MERSDATPFGTPTQNKENMMAENNEDYVLFETSNGDIVSNDPRWHAKNRLKQDEGVDVDDLQRQLAELQAQLAARGPATPEHSADDSDDELDADVEDEERDYKEVTGKDLVNLAKTRNIELKDANGSALKAGQVREALIAQDKASADNEEQD